MKPRKIASTLIVALALASLTRCTLAEVETIEEIPCPDVKIDTIYIPEWEVH